MQRNDQFHDVFAPAVGPVMQWSADGLRDINDA
jgi:tRNA U34 5-methylaminomethyl-2-thiouridine-forming methyltransferase MnmC